MQIPPKPLQNLGSSEKSNKLKFCDINAVADDD